MIEKLGPGNLENSLAPVWPSGQPHIAIEDVRNWFASYVYMLKLRDDATLDGAIRGVAESLSAIYAYAVAFDAGTGNYDGVVAGNGQLASVAGSGLLVRREVIPTKVSENEELNRSGGGTTVPVGPGKIPENQDPGEKSPKKFFATVPLNTEQAGLDVARIMDGLLVELTRTPGSDLKLTLEIEGTSLELGYPKDVVDTVKANARDLKLDPAEFGFEEG